MSIGSIDYLCRIGFTKKYRKNKDRVRKGRPYPHKENCQCYFCKTKRGETKGKNNPAYIHGKSCEPYSLNFNNQLKELIRKKDNYQCQFCGSIQNSRKFPPHHIDYNKQNDDLSNLILLCTGCNIKANYNREKWQFLFETLQEIR